MPDGMNVALTATILSELQSNLDAIFKRMPVNRLQQYDTLQKRLHSTNVAKDEVYQRTFIDFYKLRGPPSFREVYFSTLEREKSVSNLDFRTILLEIFERCAKVHASFTSKLLATVDPHMPVYDKEVLTRMRFSSYVAGSPDARLDRVADRYQSIKDLHRQAKEEPAFYDLIAEFDRKFGAFEHFTMTKKFDLMLWQSNRASVDTIV